ncbi:MAG TPA: glycogen-binding domain-containing protein [Syntrophorhabdaceae bacterium]|nr:glycogen-binding domain-containing protein [Syntrophorhabdaceae bacterium]
MNKASAKKTVAKKASKPSGSKTSKGKKVQFKLRAPRAKNVAVAGTFNDWDVLASPLILNEEDGDMWEAVIYLEPGDYEYRFLVDGDWCDDPLCMEYRCNEFGTNNSLIRV